MPTQAVPRLPLFEDELCRGLLTHSWGWAQCRAYYLNARYPASDYADSLS